ncbi:epoxyqueuosine reductase [Thermaurantimonas aggregans]|uniref:Epoxyqueuosine reductase n=1 Tax=Thermaurantimonas aggregans TaxID=2173829 RepID=A0A401XNA3_9FLAO|nr:epoxyqueuosine reductase [Thermaurantimonas aggregans]
MYYNSDIKNYLKKRAVELGFNDVRFSKAEFLTEEAPRLERWLKAGYHGEMLWMENHFDKRLDPRKLLDGCKTIAVLSHNYFPSQNLSLEKYKISKYAYGEDYHRVLKDKLHQLMAEVQEKFGSIGFKTFVDSAPVLERAWASRAGIGWVGKHSLMLTKGLGSFYFLATLLLDVALEADDPVTDHCGTCTRCIDACPTQAIVKPYIIDSNRCISYLTIEYRKELPQEYQDKMNGWIFGCDICQDVCPWNRFATPHSEPRFHPSSAIKQTKDEVIEQMEKELFDQLFSKSAVKRTKFQGLKRNIDFAVKGEENTQSL